MVTPACGEHATPLPQPRPLAAVSRVKSVSGVAGEMFCVIYFSKKSSQENSPAPRFWAQGRKQAHNLPIRFRQESTPDALQRPRDNC